MDDAGGKNVPNQNYNNVMQEKHNWQFSLLYFVFSMKKLGIYFYLRGAHF